MARPLYSWSQVVGRGCEGFGRTWKDNYILRDKEAVDVLKGSARHGRSIALLGTRCPSEM